LRIEYGVVRVYVCPWVGWRGGKVAGDYDG